MTKPALIVAIALGICYPLLLNNSLQARTYNKRINIITTDYDLLDTTYIDRGRIDGVRVGDRYHVTLRDGKTVTQVAVTGVFDRMASVKIVDSWLLKDGQMAKFKDRPMVVAFQSTMRRPAPEMTVSATHAHSAPTANAAPAPASLTTGPDAAAPPSAAPTLPSAPGATQSPNALPAAPGMPAAPGAPDALPAAPGAPDALPAAPGAPAAPAMPDAGLPPAPGAPTADAGLPPAPGAPTTDAGLPPAPGAPTADAGLPPAPGAAPDAGIPPAPGAAPAVGAPASPALPSDASGVPAPPPF